MLEMKAKKKARVDTKELIEAVAEMPCDGLAFLYVFNSELHLLPCFIVLCEYVYWKIIYLFQGECF
jgi:hypothetical protein